MNLRWVIWLSLLLGSVGLIALSFDISDVDDDAFFDNDTTAVADTCIIHVTTMGLPDSSFVYFQELLNCYANSYDDSGYSRVLADARRLYPDNADLMLDEAEFNYNLGFFTNAAEMYDTLAIHQQLHGDSILTDVSLWPTAYQHWASCWSLAGETTRADSLFQLGRQRYPDSNDLALAYYYYIDGVLHQPRAAKRMMEQQLARYPVSPEGWYLLGSLYIERNRPYKAREAFRQIQPDSLSLYSLYASVEQGNLDEFLKSNFHAGWESYRETKTYWINEYTRAYLYMDRRVCDELLLYTAFYRNVLRQKPREGVPIDDPLDRVLNVGELTATLIPGLPNTYFSLTGQRYMNKGVNSLLLSRYEQSIALSEAALQLDFTGRRQIIENQHYTPRWQGIGSVTYDCGSWSLTGSGNYYLTPDDIVLIGKTLEDSHGLIEYRWLEKRNEGWQSGFSVTNRLLDEPILAVGLFGSYTHFQYTSQYYSSPNASREGGFQLSCDTYLTENWHANMNGRIGMNQDGDENWTIQADLERSFRFATLSFGWGYDREPDVKTLNWNLFLTDLRLW
jgi:hypothetical protein